MLERNPLIVQGTDLIDATFDGRPGATFWAAANWRSDRAQGKPSNTPDQPEGLVSGLRLGLKYLVQDLSRSNCLCATIGFIRCL
jgi:hypothetical protein